MTLSRGTKPTELAITIATMPGRYGANDGWVCADEVRGRLKLLGFECTTQQVAAWLARMSRGDAPWVERRSERWGNYREYRVTRYGKNDVENRLGMRLETTWLPVYRLDGPTTATTARLAS